jgi:putative hemolysin
MTTMLLTAATTGYSALIAGDAALVEAAQRLRYRVFKEEMGAQLDSSDGLDTDEFDSYCDHLVVREDRTGEVVGTYRLLPPQRAIWLGRRYADSEFDLTPLLVLREQLVEVGRSCVHPDHRTGAVISLMWAGIARYLERFGHRWLGGCASVSLADGGQQAAQVRGLVTRRHLAPPQLQVRPRLPWVPTPELLASLPQRPATITVAPSLLRGYLRLGAWVCGEPSYDPAFGVADFYVLLGLDRMDPRYLKHFLS